MYKVTCNILRPVGRMRGEGWASCPPFMWLHAHTLHVCACEHTHFMCVRLRRHGGGDGVGEGGGDGGGGGRWEVRGERMEVSDGRCGGYGWVVFESDRCSPAIARRRQPSPATARNLFEHRRHQLVERQLQLYLWLRACTLRMSSYTCAQSSPIIAASTTVSRPPRGVIESMRTSHAVDERRSRHKDE